MKITKIETIVYGIPVKGFADAYTSFTRSDAVLIKIHTDSGHIGIGEACAWEPEFYGETRESIESTILNYAAPKIIGKDPFDIGKIMMILDQNLARITCVKEGIDLALHDLVGKILDIPVYKLLGGKFRDKVPVGSEIGINTPQAMADNALRVLKEGIKVIKIKGSDDMKLDVDRIKTVRAAVGDDVELRLDPNAAWDTIGSIRVMRAVEDCHLQLLEQPIPTWDLKGMAHIRNKIGIPVMADESIWTPQDAVKIYDYGAADLLNLKIAKTCGLHLGKKVEATAEALGLPCIAGTELEPGISAVAKIHIAASMRVHPIASEFTELTQVDGTILKQPLKVVDGCLEVPEGPGFGIEIDEGALEEYRIK
ncbi:mandelate racemase/muconate lactonizing enzyme family protein [Ulvibacterium sp.]|uniref:mandelate racemase/muconate lactonizing enzyme family protein n=1 Tax=Ulvibacterium sp. TaxID=2665914 RepID=UPI0026034595|nr:enolase C-terminal domain-like protein [Ulvibacterium sp.]